jgi:hypothetical protein
MVVSREGVSIVRKPSFIRPSKKNPKRPTRARPIRLDDLLAEGDVRGGSGRRVVFGQSYDAEPRKKSPE